MLQNMVRAAVSNYYSNQSGGGSPQFSNMEMVVMLITLFLLIFLLFFFGKYLWNEHLVKYVTIVKPVDSWIDLLAISILANIVFCR
tara:strand:+ start:4850 stop:5107 length:258 start_codon:yes stop_codon:yes gene_type:complete